MPWINLLGWMGTGLVLMAILEASGVRKWGADLPLRWLALYYGLVFLMPLGMVVAAGLWWATGASLVALLLPWGIHIAMRGRGPASFEASLASGSAAS